MKDPSEESRYAVMASELDSVREQRNITFELCAWGFGNVETFGSQMGHLWRTSQDITDTWHGLLWNIDVNDEVNILEITFNVIFSCDSSSTPFFLDRSDTGKLVSKDQSLGGITQMGCSLARSSL